MGSAERSPFASARTSQNYLRIGVVTGAHGLRGAIRMRPDNPGSAALAPGMCVLLKGPGGRQTHRVAAVAPLGHGTIRLVLEEVVDAEASAALKGRIVMIDPNELPAAKPGEFYYFQALGCEVTTVAGEALGTVAEIFPTGANDVMVVRGGTREILVPVIADVIRSIDLEARRVVVEPIPGLLD